MGKRGGKGGFAEVYTEKRPRRLSSLFHRDLGKEEGEGKRGQKGGEGRTRRRTALIEVVASRILSTQGKGRGGKRSALPT